MNLVSELASGGRVIDGVAGSERELLCIAHRGCHLSSEDLVSNYLGTSGHYTLSKGFAAEQTPCHDCWQEAAFTAFTWAIPAPGLHVVLTDHSMAPQTGVTRAELMP